MRLNLFDKVVYLNLSKKQEALRKIKKRLPIGNRSGSIDAKRVPVDTDQHRSHTDKMISQGITPRFKQLPSERCHRLSPPHFIRDFRLVMPA